MFKYIKWILLIISIFTITLIVYKYFMFNNTDNDDVNYNMIYDKEWYRVGYEVYQNGELIDKQVNLNTKRFVMFTENYFRYCEQGTYSCIDSEYSLKNNVINIPINNLLIPGAYIIDYKNDVLYLTSESENYKMIYHFETAKG